MVPTFGKDVPDDSEDGKDGEDRVIVGMRMPYDLPLVPYTAQGEPWCATKSHPEPDWKGRSYFV